MKVSTKWLIGISVILFIFFLSMPHIAPPEPADQVSMKTNLTISKMNAFIAGLTIYKAYNGSYPASGQGLNALTQDLDIDAEEEPTPIMNKIPPDHWGIPYRYTTKGEGFEIRSAGPDMQFDTDDDLFVLHPEELADVTADTNEVTAPVTVTNQPEKASSPFAKEKTIKYTGRSGKEHVYLVQEPLADPIPEDTPIHIYMHGAGGKEEQGMTIFSDIRGLMNEWGWIYVCPRDGDYNGLLKDLSNRYGERKVYLSGASAGGRSVYREAVRNALPYSGLILMCPALPASTIVLDEPDENYLPMPVWMVCGEKDILYASFCRSLESALKDLNRDVYYREIPGGHHGTPTTRIQWKKAFEFILKDSKENKKEQTP